MKSFDRAFLWLLILGIALRCVALNGPLVDHGMLRQAQTAEASRELVREPGSLSTTIPWRGDLPDRFVLEFPLYNYLVVCVHALIGHLDVSGKLVSVLLWSVAFVILQGLWRRCLEPVPRFWANLLFAVSPLGVFYSQAFMPESLVQVLTFGFLLLALRHEEKPTVLRWFLCAGIGALGMLVKTPAFAHLYLVLAVLIFRRERWNALKRPHYWIAAIATVAVMSAWSHYVDSVNASTLPQWTSRNTLSLFIGSPALRLQLKLWIMIVFYLGALVIPGAIALFTIYGLWNLIRRQPGTFLFWWTASLFVFYVVWFGNTAATQSYYNIVALGPLSALFGLGAGRMLSSLGMARRSPIAQIALGLLVIVCVAPGTVYLFKKDKQILAAAEWVKTNLPERELIIYRPNHRWDMIDYPYNAVFAHCTGRPTFVWTRNMTSSEREAALQRANYAVVTIVQPPPTGLAGKLYRFRGAHLRQPDTNEWLGANGFHLIARTDLIEVYKRE